jgi:hypothetical protein
MNVDHVKMVQLKAEQWPDIPPAIQAGPARSLGAGFWNRTKMCCPVQKTKSNLDVFKFQKSSSDDTLQVSRAKYNYITVL